MRVLLGASSLFYLFSSTSLCALDLSYNERFKAAQESAYQVTRDLCTQTGDSKLTSLVTAGMEHTWRMLEEDEHPDEGAPELEGLLASDGYQIALFDCYGDDSEAKLKFKLRLTLASVFGNFAVVAAVGGTVKVASIAMEKMTSWLIATAWATENIKFAYLTQEGIGVIKKAIDLAPLVPFTLTTAEQWTLKLCSQIDSCWTYYSQIKVDRLLSQYQKQGAHPLAELQYETMKQLVQKIKSIQTEKALREQTKPLSAKVRQRVDRRIALLQKNLNVLSENSGLPIPYE